MRYHSSIIGIASACFLLAVLALARLLVVKVDVPDLKIREIETITLGEPPPPPPEDPPPDAPPPPPALTQISEVPDPTRVPVPKADVPMDVTLPVETFSLDVAPAPLPEAPVQPRPQPQPAAPKPAPAAKPAPPKPAPPAPAPKSHYQVNELDGQPRLLRHGSATFPPALARQGVTRGTVVFEVEISQSGGITVRRVVSSSHPDLVAPARRVAAGSRFTPPTRQGQPVRAIMRWPITIQK